MTEKIVENLESAESVSNNIHLILTQGIWTTVEWMSPILIEYLE